MAVSRSRLVTQEYEFLDEVRPDDAMQKKWKAFCRKIDTKTDDFDTVLRTIKVFLTKPYAAVLKGKEFTEYWSTQNNDWRVI